MKRYLMLAAAALAWAACTNGPKNGYVITGTVEGGADGDLVYLESINDMVSERIDSAVIAGGRFTFKGKQDSTVLRYLSCVTVGTGFNAPFFLENGTIRAMLRDGGESVTGTPTNEIYQTIRSEISGVLKQMNELSDDMEKDTSMTLEQKYVKMKLQDSLDRRYSEILKDGMRMNMDNPVGIYLFKLWFYENSLSENLELFGKIPERYLTDSTLLWIKSLLDRQKMTEVEMKYQDFTMLTPEGETVSLSDYVGKGKYVLVDFWASWCGPCRYAMHELKKVYAKHKGRLEVVGVSFDADADSWKKAIDELGLPWRHMSDLKGWKSEAAVLYGVNSIPHTLLIDPQGMIIARGLEPRDVVDRIGGNR